MIYFDTETCGLHGPIVLLQYAIDDGEIKLELMWHKTINEALEILDQIIYHEDGVCAFNITFDWFHICQMYTTLLEMKKRQFNCDEIELVDQILGYAICEEAARNGPCIKPFKACDVMLHARKGKYQSTMDRKPIKIKRIPNVLADKVRSELDKRVQLNEIYFARRKKKDGKQWQIRDLKKKDRHGEEVYDPDFKNIELKFSASSGLKALATDALKLDPHDVLKYKDVEVDRSFWPDELGYAPYALSIATKNHEGGYDWNKSWPSMIPSHIRHWEKREDAREYAKNDIVYLRELYKYFGSPELGDDDSELACMVAACRWRGFAVNREKLIELRQKFIKQQADIPTAPKQAAIYLKQVLTPEEILTWENSTKKAVLIKLSKFLIECPDCVGEKCLKCDGKGKIKHPVAERAKEILGARIAGHGRLICEKLLHAGRFHAELKVIGALSSRMSGGRENAVESIGSKGKRDGLNPQGIPHSKEFRSCFDLAWFDKNEILCGGDFDAFEVTLADAAYDDELLRKELLTCGDCGHVCTIQEYQLVHCTKCRKCGKCGEILSEDSFEKQVCSHCKKSEGTRKKIHALFGQQLAPEKTYEEIVKSKGQNPDYYDMGKRGVFATIYGGDHNTLKEKLGVDIELAEAAYQRFIAKYLGVARARKKIYDSFCSMRQPEGIGSQVLWHEPAEYIESLLGFKRYFELENAICRTLFSLANNPPREWTRLQVRVQRRERVQTVSGATQSAIYGAAFQIQAAAMRAAANHVIQSAGATITKHVQRKLWDLQPSGVNPWKLQPLNIHDEIMCSVHNDQTLLDNIRKVVTNSVESFRNKVPLIKMEWKEQINNWGEK